MAKKIKSWKQDILKLTGWTTEKYNKEYDKLRNQVRNYQKAIGGIKRNVSFELFLRERNRKNPLKYELSGRFELYKLVGSQSTGRQLSTRKIHELYFEMLDSFSGFIQSSLPAQKIINNADLTEQEKILKLNQLLNKLTLARNAVKKKLQKGDDAEFVDYSTFELIE